MKTKWIALIVLLASLFSMRAATNDLTTLLQKGLFEEEANHNLEAAMQAYQSAIAEHDKDRKLVATAVFRLGECYRKQGKTNEASAQYQRVLREFPDQGPLVKLSKNYVGQGAAVQLAQDSTPIATTSEEDEEVRAIKAMIQNSPDLIDAAPPRPNNKTPLQNAAEKGHLKTAEYLLANGADVNKDGSYYAPIYLAARNGHKAMVELLLAHGAKVEKTGALREAASHGFKGVVEALIAAKTDVNEGSPLSAAAGQGSKAVVELLIAAKADVNQDSPLRAAANCGSLPIVEMLISNKADVNAKDNSGWTPLLKSWDVTIARLLIANGAQVNAKTSRGETPLYLAVVRGDTNMTKLLLENGADPEGNAEMDFNQGALGGRNRGASSALGEAIVETYANSAELVELLLKGHANPNAKFDWQIRAGQARSERGSTALSLAIVENKPEIVELLLAHSADPDLKTDDGAIPVVRAISLNRKEIVQALIKYKAKLDIRFEIGALLAYAANSPENRAGILDLLCQSGLNVNERNSAGETALHRAVMSKGRENIETLIARGADVNALDNDGKPPLAYTNSNSRNSFMMISPADSAKGEAIAEILRKAGANDNYERLTRIWIRQQGESKPQSVFYKGTNSLNQFGLIETIAASYTIRGDTIPFPDLSRVTIDRLQADGKTSRIPVDVANILKSGDRTKDVRLQWGDIVEIPEQDHNVSVPFSGLPQDIRTQLTKWMLRNVTVMIKGQSNTVTLYPVFRMGTSIGTSQFGPPGEVLSVKNPRVSNAFELGSVLRESHLLLVSSDLRRVRVNRANPVGDEPDEVVMDVTKQQNPDLWLRDGDVIEVPERDPNAPVLPAAPSGATPVGNPVYYQWASPEQFHIDGSKAASGGASASFASPIAQPTSAPALPAAPARAAFSVNLGAPSTGASVSVANPNAQPTSVTPARAVGVLTPAAVPNAPTNAIPRPTRTLRPGTP